MPRDCQPKLRNCPTLHQLLRANWDHADVGISSNAHLFPPHTFIRWKQTALIHPHLLMIHTHQPGRQSASDQQPSQHWHQLKPCWFAPFPKLTGHQIWAAVKKYYAGTELQITVDDVLCDLDEIKVRGCFWY